MLLLKQAISATPDPVPDVVAMEYDEALVLAGEGENEQYYIPKELIQMQLETDEQEAETRRKEIEIVSLSFAEKMGQLFECNIFIVEKNVQCNRQSSRKSCGL